MKPEKKLDLNTELDGEELNSVAGGLSHRPQQQEMKPCIKCQRPIPANKTPCYCGECLEKLRKQGVRMFI